MEDEEFLDEIDSEDVGDGEKRVLFFFPHSYFEKFIKPAVLVISILCFVLEIPFFVCTILSFSDIFKHSFIMAPINILFNLAMMGFLLFIGYIGVRIYVTRDEDNTVAHQSKGCTFIVLVSLVIMITGVIFFVNVVLMIGGLDVMHMRNKYEQEHDSPVREDDYTQPHTNPNDPYSPPAPVKSHFTYTSLTGLLCVSLFFCCCCFACCAGIANYQVETIKEDAEDYFQVQQFGVDDVADTMIDCMGHISKLLRKVRSDRRTRRRINDEELDDELDIDEEVAYGKLNEPGNKKRRKRRRKGKQKQSMRQNKKKSSKFEFVQIEMDEDDLEDELSDEEEDREQERKKRKRKKRSKRKEDFDVDEDEERIEY